MYTLNQCDIVSLLFVAAFFEKLNKFDITWIHPTQKDLSAFRREKLRILI